MSYNKSSIFERIGVLVKWYNKLDTLAGEIDSSLMSEVYTDYSNANSQDRLSLKNILEMMENQKSTLDGCKDTSVAAVKEVLTDNIASLINSPEAEASGVLQDLIKAMEDNGDTVQANTIYNDRDALTNAQKSLTVYDSDGNTVGSVTLEAVGQMARPDNYFKVVCIDANETGKEKWAVKSSILNQSFNQAVSNEEYTWEEAGVSSLTINTATTSITGTAGVISDVSLDGIIKGDNCDSDGKLYVSTSQPNASAVKEDDDWNQLDFSLSNIVFGEDTDTEGKIHVSIDAAPDITEVSAGVTAELSNAVLVGVGSSNTDSNGLLYAKITESGGTYTVSLYSNSDRSTGLVASGTTTETPGDVTLAEANASGLSGVVTLEWFEATEDTVVIQPPKYTVKLYNSSDRTDDDLRAASSAVFDPNTGTTINFTAKNDSTINGTAELRYTEDNMSITYTPAFYFVDFYSGSDMSTLVARGGSIATANGLTVFEEDASGISGSVDLDSLTAVSDIVVKMGYNVDDYFEFHTHSLDNGLFQTFFREGMGEVLPSTSSSPTVSETLAGA